MVSVRQIVPCVKEAKGEKGCSGLLIDVRVGLPAVAGALYSHKGLFRNQTGRPSPRAESVGGKPCLRRFEDRRRPVYLVKENSTCTSVSGDLIRLASVG